MRFSTKLHLLFSATLCLVFSACSGGGVKETLGLKKKAPDEFMVYSRPPLSVPPDFALRPPLDAGERGVSNYTRDQAREALITSSTGRSPAISSGGAGSASDRALLNRAGADMSDATIRRQLEEDEAAEDAERLISKNPEEEEGLVEKVLSPIIPDKNDPVVDADKEQDRLVKNKKEGKSVTEGETPTIKTDENVIKKIFR